mmetsp:Transcript_5981/g.12524  ORF Transcript_5981/g.12524 Transcript_5981/m.12524 type:complete len:371 (-) Transcript_5981:58-1170(-)
MTMRSLSAFVFLVLSSIEAFTLAPTTARSVVCRKRTDSSWAGYVPQSSRESFSPTGRSGEVCLLSSPNNNNNEQYLAEKFGGYTSKQRLREEIDSPFRKVRFFFFGSSAGSAFVALYFSALSVLKANMGGYSDAIPLSEALESCAVNLAGVIVCSGLAWREYQVGEANLKRIAKGGALARLALRPCSISSTGGEGGSLNRSTMADYRRNSRVLMAVGGKEYIQNLARSLNADQLKDENIIPKALAGVDMVVVPVLLESDGKVGDTRAVWADTVPKEGVDKNFDITRSDQILAFPLVTTNWDEYLESELDQAKDQGFDCVNKGITISVKKNGKILRRASGQPQWGDFIAGMEIMDGSKFGMPGDSEKYGGP